MNNFTILRKGKTISGSIQKLALIGFMVLMVSNAIAQMFTNTSTTGGANSWPFNAGSGSSDRTQFLFAPGQFSGAFIGNITKIYIKPASTPGTSPTYSDLTIKIGYTSLTSLVSGPWVTTGMTTCFYLSSCTLNSVVTNTWYPITLQTPFFYDPSKYIIVDMYQSSYTGTGFTINQWSPGIGNTRMYGNYTSTSNSVDGTQCAFGIDMTVACKLDAGISAITSPSNPSVPGIDTVKCILKSFGKDTLKTVNLKWSVDGVPQSSPSSWSGVLVQNQTYGPIKFGTYNFTTGAHIIKCWTEKPNGKVDSNAYDDTCILKLQACNSLSGIYIIDPSGAGNYKTFNAALTALNYCGVSGPVKFRVKAGTYTENLTLPAILGTSATNTITFESYNLDSTSVILTYSATGTADNYVVQLNGANYVTFRKMTIKASGTTYGWAVQFNGSSYCSINNNIIQTFNTSSSYFAGIYSTSTLDQYNTISNNIISGGYYSIYWYGPSTSTPELGNVISGNIISNFYVYGIYTEFEDGIKITKNSITSLNAPTTCYGIYSWYIYNASQITKNIINITGTSSTIYGIYCYYYNYGITSSSNITVANNFISIGGSYTYIYGMYLYYCSNLNICYNSVNVYVPSNTYYALYGYFYNSTTGCSVNLLNNILANPGGGYAAYISTSSITLASNYNDLYTTGSTLGYLNNTYTSLALWQSGSGQDAKSLTVNPGFFSNTDLHINTVPLYHTGTPVSGFTDDIDGDSRNATTPCIGADEFMVTNRDASITTLISPAPPCPGVSSSVIVKLKNFGLDPIKSIRIKWTINGTTQTPYLLSCNLYNSKDTNIYLGTYTFNVNNSYNIKVWADSVNSLPDQNHKNDTLICKGVRTALSGTYTIGSGKNYTTFNAALNDLKSMGVCGATTFVADSGSYSEQLSIPAILGASATNTITFKSASNDSTFVVINYNAVSTPDNYVVQLNGASYIQFQKITLKASPTGSYAYCVELMNGASYNTIKNCVLLSSTASSSYAMPVYNLSGTIESYNTILNNHIVNGYYSIYWIGGSTTAVEKGNVIQGNLIEGFQYYGILSEYEDSIIINGNTFNSYSGYYGIYSYYFYNYSKIINNKISINGTSTLYGIYLYYCTGTPTKNPLIANNFIALNGTGTTNTVYGIYSYYGYYNKIYYNTISITCGSPTYGRCMYLVSPSSGSGYGYINIENNILVNTGGGYTFYFDPTVVSYASYVNVCDYNDLYSTGTYLACYGSTNVGNLSGWGTTSGKDHHSMSVLPSFMSPTDLHLTNYTPFGVYNVLPDVTTDIDGQSRSTTRPMIGADERPAYPNDAGITQILSPNQNSCEGPYILSVRVANFGTKPMTGVDILWSVNGVPKPTFHLSKTLGLYKDTVITIGIDTFFYTGNLYKIVVKTNLPNGVQDQSTVNDADSLYNIKIYAMPVMQSVISDTICKGSSGILTAKSYNSKLFNWWDKISGGNLVSQDSIFITPKLSASQTYYVEAATPGFPDSLKTGNSTTLYEMGNMFVVKAINGDIHLDSFAVQPNVATGTIMTIAVWYRHGTYKGYETDSTKWTFLGSETVPSRGVGNFVPINIGNLRIANNDSFAFYVTSTDPYTLLYHTDGSKAISDKYIKVTTGDKLYYPFDIYYVTKKTWNGIIYYTIGSMCTSTRVPVYAVVNKTPNVNLGNDTGFCKGGKLLLNAGSGPAFSYVWKYNQNAAVISTKQSINTDSSGWYKVMVSDTCGNTSKDSLKLSIYPIPKVDFTVQDSAECFTGNMFFFNDATTLASGHMASYLYKYSDGATDNLPYPVHSFSAAGNYNVKLIAASDKGCKDSSSLKTVFVNPVPKADFTITDTAQCLKGNLFQFTDNSSIKNDYISVRRWDLGDGYKKNDTNTLYTYKTDNTYTIKLLVYSSSGCTDSTTRQVIVYPQPNVNYVITTKDTQCIATNSFVFLNLSGIKSGNLDYAWSMGDGNSDSNTNTKHSYQASGTYNIKLTASSDHQCTESIIKSVLVLAMPVVKLGNDTSIIDTAHIVLNAGPGFDSYLWSNGSDKPKITVDSNGIGDGKKKFWVLVTQSGCSGSDTILITFEKHVNSINTISNNNYILIYPNPSHGNFFVNLDFTEATQVKLSVINIYGESVSQFTGENITHQLYPVNLTEVPQGIYFLRIDTDKESRVFKLNVVR